ncbi:aKG-HExxH-type peptide beta-hydroxylase [Nannocystaceae bacterium ST9]
MQPLRPPHDLTIPAPGSTTARDILSRAIRRAIQDLIRLAGTPGDRELARFKPLLQRLLHDSPGALASALRRPNVGGLLRCLRRRAPELPFADGVAELLATLYTELAHADALPEGAILHRLPTRIVSLAARKVIDVPAGAERAEFGPATIGFRGPGLTLDVDLNEHDEAPRLFPITDHLLLALADANPLAMSEAHPDKQGNAVDLGGHPVDEWTASLADALELIARYMPDLRGEIDLYLHTLIPVGWDEHQHLSASYQEIIGSVYMTLHPHRMTMVEATIHEFQHNKLHALLELDPLLHNAFAPLYSSPVRPDPRPLQGVLLAVHAFQPVARLYQLMRDAGHPGTEQPDFARRHAQIVKGNHEGASVLLEHGRPTAIGQGLLDEIRRWDSLD